MMAGHSHGPRDDLLSCWKYFPALKAPGCCHPDVIADAWRALRSDAASAVTLFALPSTRGHLLLTGTNPGPVTDVPTTSPIDTKFFQHQESVR